MFELEKNNIQEYLKEKFPQMDTSRPLAIYMLGEGSAEEDGDGYLNYIYRVGDGKMSIVLKQGRVHGRRGLTNTFVLPLDRNRLEYQAMKIRHSIVPEYVPGLYFYDEENRIMAMEDVSHLKVMRYQLNKNVVFPNFASQIAEYMAKSHFYTSEYYVDTKLFRDINVHFMNHEMRDVYDDMVFITKRDEGDRYGIPVGEAYMPFVERIILDPQVIRARYELKHMYMSNAEVLVHADLHTSNIMISRDELKVIDMEYAFCGPLAYDMGYVQSNIMSQYITAAYRPFPSEKERESFRKYCLDTMRDIFEEYCRVFFECWDRDAKPVYRKVEGIKEKIRADLLRDMIGFCATISFARSAGPYMYPEYSELNDTSDVAKAVCISMVFDRASILKRDKYRDVQEWIDELVMVEELFRMVGTAV